MKINRKILFDGLRKLFGKFDQVQVDVIGAIVDEFERRKLTDTRWLAYKLATAKGECNFRPVREIGRGKGKKYGKPVNGHVYYGRGLVQLTWDFNYREMGKRLNLPLLAEPDLALETDVAVAIMFEGMVHGAFTGKKLADYFSATVNDPVNARRIINGTDKAKTFAKWHDGILRVLEAAREYPPIPAPGATQDVSPVDDASRVETGPRPGTAAGGAGHSVLLMLVALAAAIGMGLLVWLAGKLGA